MLNLKKITNSILEIEKDGAIFRASQVTAMIENDILRIFPKDVIANVLISPISEVTLDSLTAMSSEQILEFLKPFINGAATPTTNVNFNNSDSIVVYGNGSTADPFVVQVTDEIVKEAPKNTPALYVREIKQNGVGGWVVMPMGGQVVTENTDDINFQGDGTGESPLKATLVVDLATLEAVVNNVVSALESLRIDAIQNNTPTPTETHIQDSQGKDVLHWTVSNDSSEEEINNYLMAQSVTGQSFFNISATNYGAGNAILSIMGKSILQSIVTSGGGTNTFGNAAMMLKVLASSAMLNDNKLMPVIETTQAQYNGLMSAGTLKSDVIYALKDVGIYINSEKYFKDIDLSAKQDTLTSGTNIKTVGGTSILGSGNIAFPAVPQNRIKNNLTTAVNLANNTAVTLGVNASIVNAQNNARISAFLTFTPDATSIILAEALFNTKYINIACDILINGTVRQTLTTSIPRNGINKSINFECYQNVASGDIVTVRITPTIPTGGSCSIPASTTNNYLVIS